jgi:predicted amidohydrolase YtcJ
MSGLDRRTFLRAGAGLALAVGGLGRAGAGEPAELLLVNGRIATLDPARPRAEALAVRGGRVVAAGTSAELLALRAPRTQVVDLGGRTAIPGLHDSHQHPIRAGLSYNQELRWEGISTLGEALERLREQAQRTPPPQWVRVVGGFTAFQFREGRLPTLAELNAAAPETPVFVLHLYDRALLNRAALRALGYENEVPAFAGGFAPKDAKGRPSGMLVAKPSAQILYATLALAPRLSPEDQTNSSRHFQRELNRLGVTSVLDAGGGGQRYPEDYAVVRELARRGELTVRFGCDLFAQKAGEELADYRRWVEMTRPGDGDDFLRTVGGGENLTWAAADFENFREARPDLGPHMEAQLEPIVRLLAERRWPFRIHATYDESIDRFLTVFERVNADVPLRGLHWFIDHAETISERNLERVRALEGGIAVQNRMSFQGEWFAERYGRAAAAHAPPVRRMLELGIPVGAGTDGTRVSSYDPWPSLDWLVTGRTLGGTALRPEGERLSREEALRLWTRGSAWFSSEADRKGALAPGFLADVAVLSKDYFAVPEDEIKTIESVLTVLGGKIVYAAGDFAPLAPPLPAVSPDWSPVARWGGAARFGPAPGHFRTAHAHGACAGDLAARAEGGGCPCAVI